MYYYSVKTQIPLGYQLVSLLILWKPQGGRTTVRIPSTENCSSNDVPFLRWYCKLVELANKMRRNQERITSSHISKYGCHQNKLNILSGRNHKLYPILYSFMKNIVYTSTIVYTSKPYFEKKNKYIYVFFFLVTLVDLR